MSGDNDPQTTSRSERSEDSGTEESSIQHTTESNEAEEVAMTTGMKQGLSFKPLEPKFGGVDITGLNTLTP